MSIGPVRIFWKWHDFRGDEAFRHWLETGAYSLEKPVKTNAKRSVWKAAAPDGKIYFIKREHRSLFSFRNKAASELKISRLLSEKCGIDCVQFAAFGTHGRDTLLVSEAVPDAVTAKEFWFDDAVGNESVRSDFLQELRDLLCKMKTAKLRHLDFHAGNVLICRKDGKMLFVDLAEIHPSGNADTDELAHICTDFLPGLSDAEAEFVIGGITADAHAVWIHAKENLLRMIENEWDKRKKQILTCDSKFSRTADWHGKPLEIASDECFRARELPENMDPFIQKELAADEAESLWLGMFRARLEGRIPAERYFALERLGEKSILYVESDKNPREKLKNHQEML